MTSRRRFLGSMGALVVSGAALALWGRVPLRRLLSTSLPPDPAVPLRASTAGVLRAAVLALLDERVEAGHYVELFRWRSLHVPGAGRLYRRFEAAVDRAARAGGAAGFRSATRAQQRRILDRLVPARRPGRLRRVLLERDRARFARHVVREIFRLFARTDAWVLAGYDAWPGVPRAIAHLGPGTPRP